MKSSLSLLAFLGGCQWYVTEAMVRDAQDRDDDGFAAWQVGGADCNDDDPQIHPSAAELCGDLVDNDCDNVEDDVGVGNVFWFADLDSDGFGSALATREACPNAVLGRDWVLNADDCDDTRAGVNPASPEECGDGIDNNCDGVVDVLVKMLWSDLDQDGYGDPNAPVTCEQQVLPVPNQLDCDDTNAEIHPNALEICDGLDNDCNDAADEVDAVATADGITNFADVDDALQTAESKVVLCAGDHVISPLRIPRTRDLTIAGLGAGKTTLSSADADTLFEVEGGTLELIGLSVLPGSMILVQPESDLMIESCWLTNSESHIGVDAYAESVVTMRDTDLLNAASSNKGKAVFPAFVRLTAAALSMAGGSVEDHVVLLLDYSSLEADGVDWRNAAVSLSNDDVKIDFYFFEGVTDVSCGNLECRP